MNGPEGVLCQVRDARVLVVDDWPANTALVHRVLERAGLPAVTEVNDPTAVMSLLTELDPDLVLLDLKMPGVDGFEVLQQVQRHSAGAFLPVVVLTADDSRQSVKRALELGAHDYLNKPFDATELTLRVRNLLLTRFANQELRRSRALLNQRLASFEPEVAGVDPDSQQVRELIAQTVTTGGFRVALQPIFDLATRLPVGAEVLSRFPTGTLPHPAAWFSAAHRVGLGVDLEAAVLARARRLLDAAAPGQFVALNVSPRMLLHGVQQALGRDTPWSRVVLELTEHAPIEDYTAINLALAPLREQGARLAVDDTGAGFASLRHILDVSPDIIKLDIGIIRGVDRDPRRAAIAEMIIHFARRVDAEVVCEGIETEPELDTLMQLGATWGQGYLLARPRLVDEHQAGTAQDD